MSDSRSITDNAIECGYLLKLPAELRVVIYELVVRSDRPIDLISLPQPASCFKDWHTDCTYPAITLAPNQVGREALSVFFTINRFVADVIWAATSKDIGMPCHITELHLKWGWCHSGEANLSAMVAWAGLWARPSGGERCVPKAAALKHNFTGSVACTYNGPFQTSEQPPGLYDDLLRISEQQRKNAKIIARCESLRKKLQVLGARYRKAEAENVLEGYSLETRIVQWVMKRWDADRTGLKNYIRSQWCTSRWQWGKYIHVDAHEVLERLTLHRNPLFRLTKELRARIYKLALDCDDAHPKKHRILLQSAGANNGQSWRHGNWYAMSGFYMNDPPRELLLHSFPPLLQLTSQLSTEAMEVYFQHRVLTTSLEFTEFCIGSLRDFACEVQKLLDKPAICLELHVEWLWPREVTLRTLMEYLSFIRDYRAQPHIKLVRVPATSTLTRVLATLLDTLEQIARTRGREFGSPRQQLLGERTAEELFPYMPWTSPDWYGDCLLDWAESASEESPSDQEEEAKMVCRELFRQELQDRKTNHWNVKLYKELIVANTGWNTVPSMPRFPKPCKICNPLKNEVQQSAAKEWLQMKQIPSDEQDDGEASYSNAQTEQPVTWSSLTETLAALAFADEALGCVSLRGPQG
ncbi:hypothetical protein LTR22_021844 [Elasticomyces elasticus]|nr:hypothetical protein LTR22_021844 [Elasticomyces elasticus]KAK4911273.1 hypothetical protein LTR49_020161 [Elasticomyces elasticus]KAK5756321.1 hypothetical protein LTS12_013627 [Elasticomyces elasticus]